MAEKEKSAGKAVTDGDPVKRIAPNDTEALAKAGQSAADVELALPAMPAGEEQIVKQSPEIPTLAQVEASEGTTAGLPEVKATMTYADGEEEIELRPDDAATIAQRTASDVGATKAAAARSKGHWSNPNLTEMTDEEKEADAKAYASRVS